MSSEAAAGWACRHCGKFDQPRIPFPPWPGELGRRLLAEICKLCWDEWMGMQTRLINEYRLNVLNPSDAEALRDQMEIFFGYKAPPEKQ